MKNRYEIRGDVTVIFCESPKYGVKEVTIDTTDFDIVDSCPNTWRVRRDSKSHSFYVSCHVYDKNGKDTGLLLHRLLMNPDKNMVVDHIDRDTLNNKRSNLRVITKAQNKQNLNAFKGSSSGKRGVYWHKASKKWAATFTVDGHRTNLGTFDTIEEAEMMVVNERKKYMPYSCELV